MSQKPTPELTKHVRRPATDAGLGRFVEKSHPPADPERFSRREPPKTPGPFEGS